MRYSIVITSPRKDWKRFGSTRVDGRNSGRVLWLLIGAACANSMGSQLIIFLALWGCYKFVISCFMVVWDELGYAKVCYWIIDMLGRTLWKECQCCNLEGNFIVFDGVLEGEECMHIWMKCTLSSAVEVLVLMVLCNYRIIKKEKRLLNCNNECIYLMPPVMNISAILNW